MSTAAVSERWSRAGRADAPSRRDHAARLPGGLRAAALVLAPGAPAHAWGQVHAHARRRAAARPPRLRSGPVGPPRWFLPPRRVVLRRRPPRGLRGAGRPRRAVDRPGRASPPLRRPPRDAARL